MTLDINFTLIIQMLVFAAFVAFTMKFVWPPLAKALEERQSKIADGLAAAERGRKELELAQHRIKDELKAAKAQASDILDKAKKQSLQLIDEAKQEAKIVAQREIKAAQEQLHQDTYRAKNALRQQVAGLAVNIAEKIIQREIDEKTNQDLLDNLIAEV